MTAAVGQRGKQMGARKTTYTAIGNVRGDCGHKHRSPAVAARCCARDHVECKKLGGYSDRQVVGSDGTVWCYHIDPVHGVLYVINNGAALETSCTP